MTGLIRKFRDLTWSLPALACCVLLSSACGEAMTLEEFVAEESARRAEQSADSQEVSAADLLLVLVALVEFSEEDFAWDDGPVGEVIVAFPSAPHSAGSAPGNADMAKSRAMHSSPSPDPAPENGSGAKTPSVSGALGSSSTSLTVESMRTAANRSSVSPDPAPESPDGK